MRRIFFLAFVAVFLLQGTLLACLNPSFKKIVTAVPMACCAKACQKTISEDDAQTACDSTAMQANRSEFIKTVEVPTSTPFVGHLPTSYKSSPFFALVSAPKRNDDYHRRSLPLYVFSHAFLI